MTLHINTKDSKQVTVSLKKNGLVADSLTEYNEFGSQVLLPLIDKIFKQNKLEYRDLESVEVETGPGSFTGLRIGAAVANAIGFGVGIKVNGKKMETNIQY